MPKKNGPKKSANEKGADDIIKAAEEIINKIWNDINKRFPSHEVKSIRPGYMGFFELVMETKFLDHNLIELMDEYGYNVHYVDVNEGGKTLNVTFRQTPLETI